MEIFRALGALAEPPGPSLSRLASLVGLPAVPGPAEHTDVFTFQLSPYASVYVGPEGAMGGEARDRVAGFWRALGQESPPDPDHLATLLALYAALGDQESAEGDAARRTLLQHSRKALFWEHIGCWVFAYLDKMEEIAPPFYQRWARVLRAALLDAARDVGPPDRLPLHFREPAPLPDPRADGFEAFAGGLLAMARSGMLLTRADLVRGGAAMGLAVRIGDRKFLIKTLLGQDAVATLAWLAGEADQWAARHQMLHDLSPAIAAHWAGKAQSTAGLLRALADDAQPVAGEADEVLGAGHTG